MNVLLVDYQYYTLQTVDKWQYRFYIDTKWMIFNVFNFHLYNRIDKIVQFFSCCYSY